LLNTSLKFDRFFAGMTHNDSPRQLVMPALLAFIDANPDKPKTKGAATEFAR
jgi:hypothetical protein